MSFRSAVALVTGGGSGIGRALCAELSRQGAQVVVTDRDERSAQVVADSLDHAQALAVDVTDARAVQAAVDDTVERYGRLDLLVNNAGIGLAGEVRDMTVADWQPVVDVNLWGVIHGVAAAYPVMIRQGAGAIVNVASGAGLLPRPGMTAYATTKFAVVGLSSSLRPEAAAHGVQVNVVCPGHIDTPILDSTTFVNVDEQSLRARIAQVPLRGIPADVCAQRILRGVARDRALILINRLTRVEWFLYRLFPWLGAKLGAWRGRQLCAHRKPQPELLEASA